MRINTNVSAINTLRQLGKSQDALAKSVGRLSSGFRINSASDDAAGLGIANKLRSDVRSMTQASRNAEQANSLLQVAEGGAQTIQSILERMKELATQAASDNTDSAGRTAIDKEFDALRTEIDRIVDTTKFQGKKLLNGGFGSSVTSFDADSGIHGVTINGTAAATYTVSAAITNASLTLGDGTTTETVTGVADGAQTISFSGFGITLETDASFTTADGTAASSAAADTVVVAAGANGGSFMVSSSEDYSGSDLVSLDNVDIDATTLALGTDLTTAAAAQAELARIDTAIGKVSTAFGSIGAAQNRIDFARANINTATENFQAAESVIRDVNMAHEVTQMTKFQILQQAGTAVLAQANQTPQGVLRLLG
jgi:flagellin